MNNRAFLRSSEGIFTLSPKITIIGLDLCDFNIQNNTVDSQQATIEYLEDKDCYILKDLNSTYGTYVNECRIQNASIRLTHGVVIKFGHSSEKYEFCLEEGNGNIVTICTQLPTTTRKSWQPNSIQQKHQSNSQMATSLPVINNTLSQQKHIVPGFGSWTQLPRATSSNFRIGRPVSANSLDQHHIIPVAPTNSSNNTSLLKRDTGLESMKQFLPDNKPQQAEVDYTFDGLQKEIDRLRKVENQCLDQSMRIDELVQQNNDALKPRDKAMNEQAREQIKHLTDQVSKKCTEIERLQKVIDNANHHNDSISNRESDMAFKRQEVEKIRKDLQTSNRLVTTLQKDLSNRDAMIQKLNKDIEQLNRNISEKDVSISSLMNNLTRLKNVQEQIQEEEMEMLDKEREFISLRHKLTTVESNIQEKDEEIEHLNKMVEQLQQVEKNNSDTVRCLSLKLVESKALIGDLQRSECVSKVEAQDSENKYKKFRLQVIEVILSTFEEARNKHNSFDDDQLIGSLNNLSKGKLENETRFVEKQKQYEEEKYKHGHIVENIELFTKQLTDSTSSLNSGQRTLPRIRQFISSLNSVTCDEYLQSLKDVIMSNSKGEQAFLTRLESCVSSVGSEFTDPSLLEGLERIIEKYKEALQSKSLMEVQLGKLNDNHDEEIKRLKQMHDKEIAVKISETIDKESCRLAAELQIVRGTAVEVEHDQLERLSEEYEQKIETLKKIALEKESHYNDNVKALIDKSNELEDLEGQLKTVVESKNVLERSIGEQIDTINAKWRSEIDKYKEEISKFTVTVHSLNDQLSKSTKDNKGLSNQLTKMRSDTKKKDPNVPNGNEKCNPMTIIGLNNDNARIADLERNISVLRDENAVLRNKTSEYEYTIKCLTDSNGLHSNLQWELNQSLEIETLEKERNEMQIKLTTMSATIDSLTQKVKDKTAENENLVKQMSDENSKMQDCESTLMRLTENGNHDCHSRTTRELVTLGSQCRGDRHLQLIEGQKTALAEMRRKMKSMDMSRFRDSNVQDFTQQITQLKKELAELRANQSLKESVPNGVSSLTDMLHNRSIMRKSILAISEADKEMEPESKPTNNNIEMIRAYKKLQFDLDLVNAAHLDLQQSLRLSESSYFDIIRQVSEILDIDLIKGPETFDNLSSGAKRKMEIERQENCRKVIQKIVIIKEMIGRKNELLQSYEKDLAKLKQAEDMTVIANLQVEQILQQTRSKTDEVDLLRESLHRTKDLLNQEKRVNTAIKQNKYHDPERDQIPSRNAPDSLHQHCAPDDIMGQDKEKRKTEKVKRKDYEIEFLKSELSTKARQLSEATNRLNYLEITMGIKSEELDP